MEINSNKLLTKAGDFTDIQTAIDSIPSTGGAVYIKEGTYVITSSLTITQDNLLLIGTGIATEIRCNIAGISLLEASGISGFSMENIYINHQGTSPVSATNGINIGGSDNVRIISSKINVVDGRGILVDSSTTNLTVAFNKFIGGENQGIYILGDYCIVTNNNVSSFKWGIFVSGDHNIITDNIVHANDDDGITLNTTASDNIISNNRCYDNGRNEIRIGESDCNRNIIMSNNLRGTHTAALVDNGTNTQMGFNVGDSDALEIWFNKVKVQEWS